ncbi:MAG: hypothetical protein LLG04_00220, partial [Parachlamydia sp.]|nr:hypothetical protein [Parachlamydia sp.]
ISSWLFRQNPRVIKNRHDVRDYLPDLASQVQGLWKQLRGDFGNSLPEKLRDLVGDLAFEPCTERLFYRKTLDSVLRGLDGCGHPDEPHVQIQQDAIQFVFSHAGKRVNCEAPLDSAERLGSHLKKYESTFNEAMQELRSSRNPHVIRRGYMTVCFLLNLYEETLRSAPESFESLLFAFPDALLSARNREARVAMIRQLGQLLKRGCPAYPIKEEENLEGLLLRNLDVLTARDGNTVLRLIARSLFQIRNDATLQLAWKLRDRGVEEATEEEKEGWNAEAAKIVGDLTAPQAIQLLKPMEEQGVLDYSTFGDILAQIKKCGSFAREHSSRLEQLAEMARNVVVQALEREQALHPPRTLQMLLWLMQSHSLNDGALKEWLILFPKISEQNPDRELVRLLGAQLLEQALAKAQKNRQSAAFSHCCQFGTQLANHMASKGNKENGEPFPKIARLFADLPEAQRTSALYKQFQAFAGAVCRVGYSAEVYFQILQPIQNIKVPELLEAKGELCQKVVEKTTRIPENMKALVGELSQGPAACIIQARFLLDQCQKRKMLTDSQYQEMLNRICAALWQSIDEKKSNPDQIVDALKLLKECFRHLPRQERRQLFEKALKSLFVLADRNGYQALFDKEFPAFMDLLDTELLDYTLSKGEKKELPPLLDLQFAHILLDKIQEHRELAPRLCVAILIRLEKILLGRFDPFKGLQDPKASKSQLCHVFQRMVFQVTPAAQVTDQSSPEFQKMLKEYETRLARIHLQVVQRDLYLNPVNDFIFYLMLPKLENEEEEEILTINAGTFKHILDMLRENAHPHAVRNLFEILRHNKAILQKNPEILEQLEGLSASCQFQMVQGSASDWDSTLNAIAHLPEGMKNDATTKLLHLKMYRAFNKFLLANAAPQLSQRDESGEVRWFNHALVCYLKATALQITTCKTPECHQIMLEIMQDMQDAVHASSAIAGNRACCTMLEGFIQGPLSLSSDDEGVIYRKKKLSPHLFG